METITVAVKIGGMAGAMSSSRQHGRRLLAATWAVKIGAVTIICEVIYNSYSAIEMR
jgi:hypothetical protein